MQPASTCIVLSLLAAGCGVSSFDEGGLRVMSADANGLVARFDSSHGALDVSTTRWTSPSGADTIITPAFATVDGDPIDPQLVASEVALAPLLVDLRDAADELADRDPALDADLSAISAALAHVDGDTGTRGYRASTLRPNTKPDRSSRVVMREGGGDCPAYSIGQQVGFAWRTLQQAKVRWHETTYYPGHIVMGGPLDGYADSTFFNDKSGDLHKSYGRAQWGATWRVSINKVVDYRSSKSIIFEKVTFCGLPHEETAYRSIWGIAIRK